jgi:hypothetical protein
VSALADDLNDLSITILGLRDPAEATARWPSILGRLRDVRDGVRRRRSHLQRMPDVEASADWARRSLYDAKIPDELAEPAEVVIAEIKRAVAPPSPAWKLAPAPLRR